MKYFAYGSNMLTTRLQARVKSASNPTPFALSHHRLHFHKRSSDYSGKCNVICTNDSQDVVHGIIFDVKETEIPELDKYEGLGFGYLKEKFPIEFDEVEHDVLMYVADASLATKIYIDDTLVPYNWYLTLVITGAEEHGLPRDYVSKLREVPSKSDPKPNRKSRLEALDALKKHKERLDSSGT